MGASISTHRRQYLSPFYSLFEGAEEVNLIYPANEELVGPLFNAAGELLSVHDEADIGEEPVAAVNLGGGRYRLAEKMMGPFSTLTLNWGDEFYAEEDDGLRITRVVMPPLFVHYRSIGDRFSNDVPLAEIVHRYNGGWETQAVGFLTISIPADQASAFEAETGLHHESPWI